MIVAAFPLRLVRACVRFPLTRTEFRGNQFYARSVVYARLAPGFTPQARIVSEAI